MGDLSDRPLRIDEWQEVPEVLAAVKRSVDRQPEPGQFVLTGSVRAQLNNETWAGAARIVRTRPDLHHLRVEAGRREIDLIVELGASQTVALECKAGGAPSANDAKHLF